LTLLAINTETLRALIVQYEDLSMVRVNVDEELGQALGNHELVSPKSAEVLYRSTLDRTAGNLRSAVDLYGSYLLDLNTGEPRPVLNKVSA
jgi:hypothetical protein